MKIIIAASSGKSLIDFRGSLIKDIVNKGHEVYCISCENDNSIKEKISYLGASYVYVPMSRTGTNPIQDIKTIISFKKVIEEINPDMYFAYMSKPIAYGGMAAKMCKVPEINVLVSGLEIAFYSNGIKNAIVRFILKYLFNNVHKSCRNIFFQNPDDMNTFLDMKIAKKEQAVLVNGSGVDMRIFKRQPFPDKVTILMVARLVWSKGIREYISAAKMVKERYPNARFMLVGGLDTNPESLSKKELDENIQSSVIEYYGYAEDVREFLNQCSVFVLPSYHEGTPRSVLEAMATGRPIITTDAPGCRETVIDGKNGFLVPIKDSDKLAEKIIWTIEHRQEAEIMGEESFRICQEKFEVNKVNEKILKVMNL